MGKTKLVKAAPLEEFFENKAKSWAGTWSGPAYSTALEQVKAAPAVDAVEVVRCKKCIHSYEGVANLMCGRCGQNRNGIWLGGVSVKEDHFCSYGERRTDGICKED